MNYYLITLRNEKYYWLYITGNRLALYKLPHVYEKTPTVQVRFLSLLSDLNTASEIKYNLLGTSQNFKRN